MRNLSLSRRGFMALSGIGAAMTMTRPFNANTSAVPADFERSRVTAAIREDYVVASCFTNSWKQRAEVSFPSRIDLPQRSPSESVAVRWDDRLFTVDSVFELTTDGSLGRASAELTASAAIVSPSERAKALVLVSRTRDLYPRDLLNDIVDTSVAIGPNKQLLKQKRYAAAPWGAEITATWLQAPRGASADLVTVRSVGPGPIPAGMGVSVTQPRSTDGHWERARGIVVGSRDQRSQTFVLDEPLQQGQSREIQFHADIPTSSVLDGEGSPSLVSLTGTNAQWRNARDTKRYQVASVTRSGTELASDESGVH